MRLLEINTADVVKYDIMREGPNGKKIVRVFVPVDTQVKMISNIPSVSANRYFRYSITLSKRPDPDTGWAIEDEWVGGGGGGGPGPNDPNTYPDIVEKIPSDDDPDWPYPDPDVPTPKPDPNDPWPPDPPDPYPEPDPDPPDPDLDPDPDLRRARISRQAYRRQYANWRRRYANWRRWYSDRYRRQFRQRY